MSENARRDLKEGLVLYTTDNNAGLKEAWDTIQGEVKKKKKVLVEMMSSSFEKSSILPPVAVLWGDGPPRLVRGAA